MINLLPADLRKDIIFARRNTMLIHWLLATLVGLTGIFGVLLFGHAQITDATQTYQQNVNLAKVQLEEQELTLTQEKIENLSGSINLALDVLSNQVFFSRLLLAIGSTVPSGVNLQGLSIGDISGGIDLNFLATDYQTGTLVQVNLTDPQNGIFDNADILNIGCQPAGELTTYPCSVSVRALFKTGDDQFTFTAGGSNE